MPTYEFKCEECFTTGTVTASFTDTASMECPKCSRAMERVYSAPGLIFRGGGWGGS
jgi:putative FmdB family regulatory protein